MDVLRRDLSRVGMIVRGGFPVTAESAAADGLPETARAVILIGNAGPAMGEVFAADRSDGGPNPLDRWTRRVVTPIAERMEATPLFPFEGPPYYPFVAWAKRADAVFSSPIGMLIHPDYGLWHAYRAALVFERDVVLPDRDDRPSPCDACAAKPCLTTCPVAAFQPDGYRVADCKSHIATPAGRDCLEEGCRARQACPVGPDSYWGAAMAGFHMRAFLG